MPFGHLDLKVSQHVHSTGRLPQTGAFSSGHPSVILPASTTRAPAPTATSASTVGTLSTTTGSAPPAGGSIPTAAVSLPGRGPYEGKVHLDSLVQQLRIVSVVDGVARLLEGRVLDQRVALTQQQQQQSALPSLSPSFPTIHHLFVENKP